MICKNCKHEIPEGLQYCGNCGAKVKKSGFPLPLALIALVLVLGLAIWGVTGLLGGDSGEALENQRREETIPPTKPAETEETLPSQTQPEETEPQETEPPETEPPETEPQIPEDLRDNILLDFRNTGACEKMVGDVVVTVIFADVPEGGWSETEIADLKLALEGEAARMMEEARGYGTELNLMLTYLETTAPECVYGEEDAWADAALANLGMSSIQTANRELEEKYGVEAAPVIFYLNVSGRSRACWHNVEDGREFAVLYREASAFRHETSHLFGAVDYYYPDLVEEHAVRLFPGSLMYSNDVREVDSMTAYLIGWTDTLSPEAEEFLRLTNELTWDTYYSAMGDEYFTGHGTVESEGGTYTGDLVDGLMQGHGTFVWTSGTVYEGEWYFGNMHGYGTMTWPDGMVYEGYWDNGKRQGHGTLTWADGTVYVGSWERDNRHGYGTMTWSNGTVYEGQWENDKRNGQGTLTFPSGTVQSGMFQDDEFIG